MAFDAENGSVNKPEPRLLSVPSTMTHRDHYCRTRRFPIGSRRDARARGAANLTSHHYHGEIRNALYYTNYTVRRPPISILFFFFFFFFPLL